MFLLYKFVKPEPRQVDIFRRQAQIRNANAKPEEVTILYTWWMATGGNIPSIAIEDPRRYAGNLDPVAPIPAPVENSNPFKPRSDTASLITQKLDEFEAKYTGVQVDVDSYPDPSLCDVCQIYQCVDLPWKWMEFLGVEKRGYTREFPPQSYDDFLSGGDTIIARQGITEIDGKKYSYKAVAIKNYDELQRGDIVIIGNGFVHVALLDGKSDDGSVISVFEQNRDFKGSPPAIGGWPRANFYGAIRIVLSPE